MNFGDYDRLGIGFKTTIGEMPPFVWQWKKSSLYHGSLQNVLSLHHFLIRMFIHGRSFRSKAVKTGGHLDRLS